MNKNTTFLLISKCNGTHPKTPPMLLSKNVDSVSNKQSVLIGKGTVCLYIYDAIWIKKLERKWKKLVIILVLLGKS